MMLFVFITTILLNVNIKQTSGELIIQEVRNTFHLYLEQYIDNLGNRISKFNTMLNSFASSGIIKYQLDKLDEMDDDYSVLEDEIRNILNYQFPYGLYELAIYPLNVPITKESTFIKDIHKIDEDWLEYYDNGYFEKYFIHEEGTYDVRLLTVLKPIYSSDGSKINAIIKLSLSPSKVFKPMSSMDNQDTNNLFIISKTEEVIYGSIFDDTEEFLSNLTDSYDYLYDYIELPDYRASDGIYITSSDSTNGFRAVYYFPYSETVESIEVLHRSINTYIMVLLGLFIILVVFLSFSINSRMKTVLQKIQSVSQGNLEVEPAAPGKDEIAVFDSSFTDMVVQLRKNINDNYMIRMKQKDAEFMALQAQINPHFLFNSLEIINSLIEMEAYDTACLVNDRLSQLLRYSINHNSSGTVTLREEIENMKNYMYIQSIRFQDRYQLHLDIDESCLDFPIIKLIFQPFIENSFKHGFRHNQPNGNIWFFLREEGDNILIDISDDGSGITDEEYEQLMNRLVMSSSYDFKEQNDSIGLTNINYRLKLIYGDSYKITIGAPSSQGMHIQLLIPKVIQKENDL